MSKRHKEGVLPAGDPDTSARAGRHTEHLPVTAKRNFSRRQDATPGRKASANSNKSPMRTETGQVLAPADQVRLLQQANAYLVIAAIEAQKLAEQVQSAKLELDYLAHHDTLTDLPNRILLLDRLSAGPA